MVIIVRHKADLEVCTVSRDGVGMVRAVVERLRWNIGERVTVGFIEHANCMLFRSTSGDDGFRLAYSNTRKKTGGRVYCNSFIRNYIATLVTLPKKNLAPVFLQGADWQLALLLDPISWISEEFSKNGVNGVGKDAIGIYQLLGKGEVVLRIGEGRIRVRINSHLLDQRFAPPMVKTFRYFVLADSTDAQLMEKILIEEHLNNIGVLPRFQKIKA